MDKTSCQTLSAWFGWSLKTFLTIGGLGAFLTAAFAQIRPFPPIDGTNRWPDHTEVGWSRSVPSSPQPRPMSKPSSEFADTPIIPWHPMPAGVTTTSQPQANAHTGNQTPENILPPRKGLDQQVRATQLNSSTPSKFLPSEDSSAGQAQSRFTPAKGSSTLNEPITPDWGVSTVKTTPALPPSSPSIITPPTHQALRIPPEQPASASSLSSPGTITPSSTNRTLSPVLPAPVQTGGIQPVSAIIPPSPIGVADLPQPTDKGGASSPDQVGLSSPLPSDSKGQTTGVGSVNLGQTLPEALPSPMPLAPERPQDVAPDLPKMPSTPTELLRPSLPSPPLPQPSLPSPPTPLSLPSSLAPTPAINLPSPSQSSMPTSQSENPAQPTPSTKENLPDSRLHQVEESNNFNTEKDTHRAPAKENKILSSSSQRNTRQTPGPRDDLAVPPPPDLVEEAGTASHRGGLAVPVGPLPENTLAPAAPTAPLTPSPASPPVREPTMDNQATPSGDNNMSRTMTPKALSQVAFAAILGGALTCDWANAQPTSSPLEAPTPEKEKVTKDDLIKQIEENNKLIAEIKEELKDLRAIRDRIFGRKDDKGFPVPSDPGLIETVKNLSNEVNHLREQVERMNTEYKALKPSTPSPETKITIPGTMPSPTQSGNASTTTLGKGIIRIVNDYPVEISMVINKDVSYKVGPNSVKTLEVPAGEFTYELLQSGTGPVKSTIKDKETVTLRIK